MKPLIDLITFPFRLLLTIPLSVLSAPRRLLGLTLAMRVAVLTAMFLVCGTILVVAIRAFTYSSSAQWQHFFTPWWMWFIVVPVLWAVIPITLYYAVKLWLEGDVSNFPDIDLAWSKGLAALAQNGLDLSNLPVFLLVGVADDKHAQAILRAANFNYRIKGVPEGPAPLHWFATDTAIFLACTQAGRASKLAHLAAHAKSDEAAEDGLPRPMGYGGGTMVVGGGERSREVEPAPAGRVSSMTMVFSNPSEGGGYSPAGAPAPGSFIKLTKEQEVTETARLEHVAHLLRRARQPVCPANGLLAVLPFSLLQKAAEGMQLRDAVRADLTSLRHELKLRCPAVALVTGMEAESGFLELIKRVGPEPANVQRFGKGFNVHNRPTSEQLNAVGTHACGAFEDFVYAQFSKPDALRQVGNRKLYAMLYKIRAEIQPRLTTLLDSAFADDADEDSPASDEAMLFGGCYFAATGEREGSRAFVKSALEKLIDLEHEVEWTQDALDENDRYHRWAQIGMLADGLLLAAVSSILIWAWYRSTQ